MSLFDLGQGVICNYVFDNLKTSKTSVQHMSMIFSFVMSQANAGSENNIFIPHVNHAFLLYQILKRIPRKYNFLGQFIMAMPLVQP